MPLAVVERQGVNLEPLVARDRRRSRGIETTGKEYDCASSVRHRKHVVNEWPLRPSPAAESVVFCPISWLSQAIKLNQRPKGGRCHSSARPAPYIDFLESLAKHNT